MMPSPVEELIAYRFRDRQLLELALTHRSAEVCRGRNNERLEFFGDAIVGMVVSEHLCAAYPDWDEGRLSQVKAMAVSRETFARVLRKHGLRNCLNIGKELKKGGALPDSVYANIFEAVVAAAYYDSGGDFATARAITLRLLGEEIAALATGPGNDNPKAVLQNWAQVRGGNIDYVLLARQGDNHCPVFTVGALFAGKTLGEGRGRNKKEAEQNAARAALAQLGAGNGEGN